MVREYSGEKGSLTCKCPVILSLGFQGISEGEGNRRWQRVIWIWDRIPSSSGIRAPHTRRRGWVSYGILIYPICYTNAIRRLMMATGRGALVLSPQADSSLWEDEVWDLVPSQWSELGLLTTLFSPHLPMRQRWVGIQVLPISYPLSPPTAEYDFSYPCWGLGPCIHQK